MYLILGRRNIFFESIFLRVSLWFVRVNGDESILRFVEEYDGKVIFIVGNYDSNNNIHLDLQ